jgi:hypothetical protein
MFNIIKTNKKRTAIAPTYITKNEIGRNSKLNKNNKQETFVKDSIRNNTEKIGFFVVITQIEDNKEKQENK